MKILPVNINTYLSGKTSFKSYQVRFEEKPTDLKLNDLKRDLVELKDIGNVVIEQNNKILGCLDQFATIEYEKADLNLKSVIREVATDIRNFIRGRN